MAKANSPAPVQGSALIRQLARLAQSDLPPEGPALLERLSQWFDWQRAVRLAQALDMPPPVTTAVDPAALLAVCRQQREQLSAAIAAAFEDADGREYSALQRQVLNLQRAMQSACGRLRGQLREALAGQSAALARLAELDAAMEATLSPREQALLARLPMVLEAHFQRQQLASANAGHTKFANEARGLLQAELELRFHPVDALCAALASH